MMFSSLRVRLQPWFAFVTGVAIMIWSVMIYVVLFSTMLTSIRIRLTIWYTLVLSLTLISFSTLVYFSFVRVLRDETDASLLEMANNFVIAASAEQTDEIEARPLHDISEALDAFRFRDYQFGVISTDGNVVAASDEFFLPDLSEVDGTADSFADYSVKGQLSRIVQHSFRVGGANFRLIVIHSLEDRLALEERLRVSVLVAIPIALLLAGLGGYFLVRRSLQPVQTMSQRASLITSQNLHERLPVVNQKDELGNLATVFNDLLDRLEKSFAQHRRFMADASHELRTPLAIVRGESEVALSMDTRSALDYRESLAIVHDESRRLTQIVEDLFTLARADSGNFATRFTDVYLDEIAAECVHSIRTLAEKQNITIAFSAEEMPIKGDEALLRRLMLNLLDNAVKYNNDEHEISVEIKNRRVSVTNTGPEIPPQQREDIFQRFFRADTVRSRQDRSSTSGAGLGLSISKWIAELHDAKLVLARSHGGKNTFEVIF